MPQRIESMVRHGTSTLRRRVLFSARMAPFSSSAVQRHQAFLQDSTPAPSHIPSSSLPPISEQAVHVESGGLDALLDAASGSALRLGDLAAMGFCKYTPPGYVESLFEWLHVTQGLPWWATIACSTVLARVCISPLAVNQVKFAARSQIAQPMLRAAYDEYQAAKMSGSQSRQLEAMNKVIEIQRQHKIGFLDGLGPGLLTAPVFISFFLALRDLSKYPVPDMTTGGMAWFTDLTVPDPLFLLPFIASSTFLLTIERNLDPGVSHKNAGIKNVFRVLALISVPVMASFPSALSWYWTVNNLCTITLSTVLKNATVRRFFSVPITKSSLDQVVAPATSPSFREGFIKSMEVMRSRQQQSAAPSSSSKPASPFRSAK